MRDIKFWRSEEMVATGIQFSFEYVFPNSFHTIERDTITDSDINVFLFRWETIDAINPTSETSTEKFFNIIYELNKRGFKFIADFTSEAEPSRVDRDRVEFLSKLQKAGVSLKNFALAQNDSLNLHGGIMNYGDKIVQLIHFPYFLLATEYFMKKYVDNTIQIHTLDKNKDFLCLNRRVSNHKYKILKRLWERGLLKDTNWTWVDTLMDKSKIDSQFISDLGIDFNKTIQLEGDVMYGRELQYADEYLYTINPKWYYESKVDIINETHIASDRIHITEKTWKAIYLGIPFVINSSKFHLERLAQFGYKTFGNVIDENYNINRSVDNMIDSAIKLSKLYNSNEIVDITEWNKERIRDINSHKFILTKYFLEPLYKLYSKKSII